MNRLTAGWAALALGVGFLGACGADFVAAPSGSSSGAGGATASVGAGGSGGAAAPSSVTASVAASSAAGGGSVDKMIPCGNAGPCAHVCCAGMSQQKCAANVEECAAANLSSLTCNGSADCGGIQVCCLTVSAMTPSTAECVESCPQQIGKVQLCEEDDECQGDAGNCDTLKFGNSDSDTPWKACKS